MQVGSSSQEPIKPYDAKIPPKSNTETISKIALPIIILLAAVLAVGMGFVASRLGLSNDKVVAISIATFGVLSIGGTLVVEGVCAAIRRASNQMKQEPSELPPPQEEVVSPPQTPVGTPLQSASVELPVTSQSTSPVVALPNNPNTSSPQTPVGTPLLPRSPQVVPSGTPTRSSPTSPKREKPLSNQEKEALDQKLEGFLTQLGRTLPNQPFFQDKMAQIESSFQDVKPSVLQGVLLDKWKICDWIIEVKSLHTWLQQDFNQAWEQLQTCVTEMQEYCNTRESQGWPKGLDKNWRIGLQIYINIANFAIAHRQKPSSPAP